MKKLALTVLILLGFSSSGFLFAAGSTRNGKFTETETISADNQQIIDAQKAGWKLSSDLVLPRWWMPNASTPNGSFEYLRTGGLSNGPFVRLDGGGHIASYFGPLEFGKTYIGSVKVRGKGTVWFGGYIYGGGAWLGSPVMLQRDISTSYWVEYRIFFPVNRVYLGDNPSLTEQGRVLCKTSDKPDLGINLFLAGKGPIDIAEVQFFPGEPVDVEMVRELNNLYGTGGFVENLEVPAVVVDDEYKKHLAEYEEALAKFKKNPAGTDKELYDSITRKSAALAPYLKGEDKKTVLTGSYSDMIVLTRVLRRLTGEDAGKVAVLETKPAPSIAGYKCGERASRPGTVTVIDIRSNKVMYAENETATTTATVVNTSDIPRTGRLVSVMHLDLDTQRELGRTDISIPAGGTRTWSFTYNVGPETYGRGIEVRFEDEKGTIVDSWQEFYGVAAEWFRIHQHTYAGQNKYYKVDPWVTYYNQRHYFAAEPTDWGIQTETMKELETYQSGQGLNQFNVKGRLGENAYFSSLGVKHTFYQTFGYCGQMGYEVIRQHPEFALYDSNGQFGVDPIYGGYPNPMELASPLELGSNRKVIKPYLNRKLTYWEHGVANYALEDAVIFMANCIKEYAEFLKEDGVYIDGNLGIWKGYGYDGKLNVPSNKLEDFARLNGRNHNIFSGILKKENPNFGTWYNWGYRATEWGASIGLTSYVGSGTGKEGDSGDDNIRAATNWKNVMILSETGSFLKGREDWLGRPTEWEKFLVEQRDFAVQKWGANTLIGYSFIPIDYNDPAPGPSKWAWATINYHMAQLIGTQVHHASGFLPSYRPALQFTTRYSRFIWAPDIRVVPEAEKTISVKSPEELWWKELIYKRRTDTGYDLIIHLVRRSPFEKWDVNWLDEPVPLEDVKISAAIGKGKVEKVVAMRPYYYEEEQQSVERVPEIELNGQNVIIPVPGFRYNIMLVVRMKESL